MSFQRYPNGVAFHNLVYWNTQNQRLPCLSELGYRHIVIPLNFADGTTTVTTNILFPANSVILPDIYLYVRTPEAVGATKTIQVGVTGTAGAFINGMSVASAGLLTPNLTFGSVTLGSKLFVYGGTTSTAPVPTPDIEATAVALTWTPGSADWTAFRGELHLTMYQFADLDSTPPIFEDMIHTY